MQRIIITGAHGSGKTDIASRCHDARPDVPLVSLDAIDADLTTIVAGDAWILAGGPRVLSIVLPRADAVIWLDPPIMLRAWRLLSRPLKLRPEMSSGTSDHITTQYRQAWRSLRKEASFRAQIAASLSGTTIPVLACYTRVDTDSALALWTKVGIR